MKTIFTSVGLLLSSLSLLAQSEADSVITGSGYANQVWYSMENGEVASSPKNNWHLAFETSPLSSSIHINSAIGIELWVHPTADTADWQTVDTIGLSTWNKLYNSDTTWSLGAFNASATPGNPFDLGWGTYSMITHHVVGDRIFILKISESDYWKVMIERLASGTYHFRYAKLDNSNLNSASIVKSTYNTKNLIYFDVNKNQVVDREPESNIWDITFTQYIAYIPSAYLVTGVLSNKYPQTAKAYPVADPLNYSDWNNHSFSNRINTIGWDWKRFAQMQWNIQDSLVYFVSDQQDQIWSLVFTNFGGSSNGGYYFTKNKIGQNTLETMETKRNEEFSVFPNPLQNGGFTIRINETKTNIELEIKLFDIAGRMWKQQVENSVSAGQEIFISTQSLPKGVYVLVLQSTEGTQTQKLIIQ